MMTQKKTTIFMVGKPFFLIPILPQMFLILIYMELEKMLLTDTDSIIDIK